VAETVARCPNERRIHTTIGSTRNGNPAPIDASLPGRARERIAAAGDLALPAICSALIQGKLASIGAGFPVPGAAYRRVDRRFVGPACDRLCHAAGVCLCGGGTLPGWGHCAIGPVIAGGRAIHWRGGDDRAGARSECHRARASAIALRQSEERFACWSRTRKGYAIYMLDAEGRIRHWSTQAERIKGYRAEEIIGKPISHLLYPRDVERGVPSRC